MEKIITIIKENKLLDLSQTELNKLKHKDELYFIGVDTKCYKNSLYIKNNILYLIAKKESGKFLYLVSEKKFTGEFKSKINKVDGYYLQAVEFNHENYLVLKKIFPFIAPISLKDKKTTFGCGDRLGLATPGHIRACLKYDVYPVLAQQSIRELNLTKRTFNEVIAQSAFLVFQEGFERGYGADGDHLKTIEDIDIALKADMPMITLDLSGVMNAAASDWDSKKIDMEFEKIDPLEKDRIKKTYADKTFPIGENKITISINEAKKCTLLYKNALDFAGKVDEHLKGKRGKKYDFEISIDETGAPTLPEHHLFIIKELNYRNVSVNSLAPRFIGEFQKAIDYIGDIEVFEDQFIIHSEIAKTNGNYKISIHSGSDKFSVYPIIGKFTDLRLHLKTSGTSWLEAVRCMAKCDPSFYRKLHKKAFEYYNDAKKYYHITADLSKIKNIDEVTDHELQEYIERNESRQLLHITYGGLLNDKELRDHFFQILDDYEDVYYELLEKHIGEHIELLGVPLL